MIKPGLSIWFLICVYLTAAILALGFWAIVIYFGIKLAKKAWGS